MPHERSGALTRARILDAAVELMRTLGLARVTTKEIAKAAGCSEAALYRHFSGKEELFVTVLQERMPWFGALLAQLAADASDQAPEETLTEIASAATRFYEATMPIGSSLFAEPALLERHREGLRKIGAGPQKPLESLTDLLRTMRSRGEIRQDADVESAAAMLLGACHQRAFLGHFMGPEVHTRPLAEFAAGLARTVLRGIA
ncbi:TetR/AcrR family transcriptional regulator [Sphaerisporangium aureirubrum]|uniref:TetR/AcrR family transcriptional regulator n=1 Tax=Sphaerisporangium aureirubrum TaxID=1544736 RepID=A0ABW1NAL9_9ACTN